MSSDSKAPLIKKLRQAAEIEQQFMCMYLYGAYSLKKRYIDNQFAEKEFADLEMVRRWCSTLYTVARQEMEHLALANNLLRAIDAAPYFARENLPFSTQLKSTSALQNLHMGAEITGQPGELIPIDFPFEFTSANLNAFKAWTCMESPDAETLKKEDANQFAHWCFKEPQPAQSNLLQQQEIGAGTIAQLYDEIAQMFEGLSDSDFVIPSQQQVEIIQQYDIYVFPVSDVSSALQAIDLIVKQGEGNRSSIGYQSHYRRFFEIVQEFDGLRSGFEPCWQLLKDPVAEDIELEETRAFFNVVNESYEMLLVILTGLYATVNQQPGQAPYLAPALGQEAFGPMMTMVVRSLSEVLVQLKIAPQGSVRAGPSFHINNELMNLLLQPIEGIDAERQTVGGHCLKKAFSDMDAIIARFEQFKKNLAVVQISPAMLVNPELFAWAEERLNYIRANVQRIQENLQRIYQFGILKTFATQGY